MKKFVILLFIGLFGFFCVQKIHAQALTPTPPYEMCEGGCPIINPSVGPAPNYPCASSYENWQQDKTKNFWVKDPEITVLGKGGERSHQFLYWVLNHDSIDNHPSILSIWSFSRNITYFLLIIVAAVMGIGIIVSRKYNPANKIEIVPLLIKIGLLFLYATLSATLVLTIIQLSNTLMLFFIEKLGVNKLFNIFFIQGQPGQQTIQISETAYQSFEGCSNLNVNALESIKVSKFLINTTNMTYYFIGIMLIIRKIVLWFLLFVSPFLAILMPFILIRNTGWIWIGVFFQWVFYGPLFALFLGGLATIWNSNIHIPYNFDFSRTHQTTGFIYPTAINILYGGPAQHLSILNSSNYVDTFAEYIISLLMLWLVIIVPWWLLRIFRDYCCEGIYAMKNILMSMYDQMRSGPSPTPPAPSPVVTTFGTAMKIPQREEVSIKMKLETIQEIKQAKTEEMIRSLDLSASKLSDVANFETNRQVQEVVQRNLNYLANPTKAETPTERQKFMNIRTELFDRAIKNDVVAKQILSSVSTSRIEQIQKREEIIRSLPQVESITKITSTKTQIPQATINTTTSSILNTITSNNYFMNAITSTTKTSASTVQSVINSLTKNIGQPTNQLIYEISKDTNLSREKVTEILENTVSVYKLLQLIDKTSQTEQIDRSIIETIATNISLLTEEKLPLIKIISSLNNIPEEKVSAITNSFADAISNNETLITLIQSQITLTWDNIKNITSSLLQNINQNPATLIENITKTTGADKESVTTVIKTIFNESQVTREIINNVATSEQVNTDTVQKIINSFPAALASNQPIALTLATQTNLPEEKITSILQSFSRSIFENKQLINNIQSQTSLTNDNVQNIVLHFLKNINDNPVNIVNNIVNNTGLAKENVNTVIKTIFDKSSLTKETINNIAIKEQVSTTIAQKIVDLMPVVMEGNQPVVATIAIQTNLPEEKIANIMQSYIKNIFENNQLINSIQSKASLSSESIQNIVSQFVKNINENPASIINNILNNTGVEKESIVQVIKTVFDSSQVTKEVINNIASKENVDSTVIQKIVQTIPVALASNQPIATTLAAQTNLSEEKISSIMQTLSKDIFENNQLISSIQSQTGLTKDNIITIVKNYFQNVNQNKENIISSVAKETGYAPEKVMKVIKIVNDHFGGLKETINYVAGKEQIANEIVESTINNMLSRLEEKEPLVKLISLRMNIPEEKISSTIKTLTSNIIADNRIMSSIQSQTGLTHGQIDNIINTFASNLNQNTAFILNRIKDKTGIENDMALKTIRYISESIIHSKSIIKLISEKEKLPENQVRKLMATQESLLAEPEKNIEQTITIPPSISLEDYEQVKKMWMKQYEKGEVPTTENITSRYQWVDQDIVFITNTLNKLLSPDINLRNEGLMDLEYILPIFLINNLKGEELIVYLKAKLEAAKSVKELLDKEKEVAEKLQPKEEFVEIAKGEVKKEEKTMEMKKELNIEEDKQNKS